MFGPLSAFRGRWDEELHIWVWRIHCARTYTHIYSIYRGYAETTGTISCINTLAFTKERRENQHELRLTQVTQCSLCDALGSYYCHRKFVRKLVLHLQSSIYCIQFSIIILQEQLYVITRRQTVIPNKETVLNMEDQI